ncbi:MAG TPA: LLM class flavin-dependent oxidoreductase [Anaerolineales bacterium]|nr:LLM class flavin-dependent oxidoreductase [Anaerolineales bacterium]
MVTQFGLAVRNFVGPREIPDVDEILRYSIRAEELGFESLWVFDHLLLGVDPAFPILEAFQTLAAIAARTSNINLGTGILVLSLRNPVWAAKTMASLDQLSKGRFILGAASGWYSREFDAAGIPFKERGRIFERNLDIILKLWSGKPVSIQVDQLNLRDAVCLPVPYRKPRPPVLIGGYVDKVLRRVARDSDGWLTYAYTPEGFVKSWDKIKAFAREYGRDPDELNATNQVAIYVGPPMEEADKEMRHWLTTEWDFAGWSDSTVEHAVRGTVDECIEQLKGYTSTELDRIIFIPYRYQPEQVELLAKEIIPRLKAG